MGEGISLYCDEVLTFKALHGQLAGKFKRTSGTQRRTIVNEVNFSDADKRGRNILSGMAIKTKIAFIG